MAQDIPLQDFINAYKESHGADGATQLLLETTSQLGLSAKKEFSKAEAVEICKSLQEKPGFVGIVAGIIMMRLKKEE